MPKASVIIATYNRSNVLPYSIASALEQTESDIEVLVVGDGCTDDSEEVVRSIGDPRIRWFNLKERHGHQTGPNNEGIRRAESEYVFYLGHDDLWFPHHVASCLQVLEGGADLVFGAAVNFPEPGVFKLGTNWLTPYRREMTIPPTSVGHRKSVCETVGFWRHHREVDLDPEKDIVVRVFDAGFKVEWCARLTSIKFPASKRRNAYFAERCEEQEEWLERIRSDKDLEAKLLALLLARTGTEPLEQPTAVVAARLVKKVKEGVRRRFGGQRSVEDRVESSKKFKGSDP